MEKKSDSSNVELVTITPIQESNGYMGGKFNRFSKEELEALFNDL